MAIGKSMEAVGASTASPMMMAKALGAAYVPAPEPSYSCCMARS